MFCGIVHELFVLPLFEGYAKQDKYIHDCVKEKKRCNPCTDEVYKQYTNQKRKYKYNKNTNQLINPHTINKIQQWQNSQIQKMFYKTCVPPAFIPVYGLVQYFSNFPRNFHQIFGNEISTDIAQTCKEQQITGIKGQKKHIPIIQYTISIRRTRSNRESCSFQPAPFTVHIIQSRTLHTPQSRQIKIMKLRQAKDHFIIFKSHYRFIPPSNHGPNRQTHSTVRIQNVCQQF